MTDDKYEIIIPEVNSENGLKLCRGNRKIYVQSLRLFTGNIPATLTKMRGLLQQRNEAENYLKKYLACAHSVKGMCIYVGAEEACAAAKELENMADDGNLEGILKRNDNFIKQIERIIGNIQTWFKENADFLNRLDAENNAKLSAESKNG